MSDHEKLTDREIDALVAERIFEWSAEGIPPGKNHACYVPEYSTDDNAARLVRDRIAELGMDSKRVYLRILWENLNTFTPVDTDDDDTECEWRMHNATPKQICIAALQALESQAGREQG